MTDDQPPPASMQTSISDSTISDSTVNQTTIDQRGQQVGTQYNAGGDQTITHQAHPWQPRWEPSAAEAQALLDLIPRDDVPDISTLPSGSRMPFAPNPHFVGRDAVLLALALALHGGARVAIGPKAAATGIGGIGKTSVAVEVAHRLGSYFAGGVFWLSFADPAAIGSEIAACGGPGLLDLHPTYGELKQDEQLALVRQAWQKPIPRLLIFDNCEDPQLVQQWAPTSGGCRVLITSRRQRWPSGLGISALSIDVLARPASIALLRDLAPRLTDGEADELAEELGDFPLALQLAGSYLAQFGRISVDSYLAGLRSDVILAHPSLRGVHDGDVSTTAHDRHVGRTFLVSYQCLDPTRDALALALLARAACLAPGAPIPLELLLASAKLAPENSAGQVAVGRLADLGFVTVGDEAVTLHRLVHAFVGGVVQDDGALVAVEETLIAQAAVINEAGYPAAMTSLVSHLAWATRTAEREDVRLAQLCNALGYHWDSMGAYGATLPLYEQALAISERVLGPSHRSTATSLTHLAVLYHSMGIYRQAQPLYERALTIREQVLGADHPDTAQSLNNLARLYYATGAYTQAQPLYKRALMIQERVLGADHPSTAASLNNLAGLYYAIGAYVQALPLYERALAIHERVLGGDHPATAQSLNNLAVLYRVTGAFAQAQLLYERALAMREQVLGVDHPDTAQSLNNLAALHYATGAYVQAQPLYERALVIREQVLGRDHPDTALSLNNLAALYRVIGTYAQAQPLYERALAIREKVLGANHPDTATSLNNLAFLYHDTGAYKAAHPLFERALAIAEATLGVNHDFTKAVRANLKDLLSTMKDTP